MRRRLKAPSLGSISGTGDSRSRQTSLGIVCLVSLAALLGGGASAAGADDPCPNAQFRTGQGADLPDCRAYEQVSPVDKNGAGIVRPFGGGFAVSLLGDRAVFTSEASFADSTSGGDIQDATYIAERTADGWVTKAMTPRVEPAGKEIKLLLSSPDLRQSLLMSAGVAQLDPPHESDEEVNVYRRDNQSGVVTPWIGVSTSGANPRFDSAFVPAGSDRLVFASAGDLTADPGLPSSKVKVYEKPDGQPLRLVSVLPDGTPLQDDATLGGDDGANVGAVSADGSHIFFSQMTYAYIGPAQDIYRRDNGATTVLVSPSKRTLPVDPAETSGKAFQLATPDGNRLLFTSDQPLTDDANTGPVESGFRAGNDLYRYDIGADELIDISATPGGNGAQVEGVLGADEDAERIYYTAKGEVVPGEGTPGRANLYLWEDDGSADGTTRFIASLDPEIKDFFEPDPGDSSNWKRDGRSTSRITDDGHYLLFHTAASIPGGEEDGFTQVYRYDADANGGAGRLDCVSCMPAGETPTGAAEVNSTILRYWEAPRNLTQDGRVFFTTQNALLPADTNGEEDAYAWTEGELGLISTGTSPRGSSFYNASLDGRNVFFLTADALVPQDNDSLVDLYDARIDGGLASQFVTPPPSCGGEDCREAGTQSPAAQGPLTSTFIGDGNAKPHHCPKGKRRVKAANGKTRCVKKKSHKHKHTHRRTGDNRRAGR